MNYKIYLYVFFILISSLTYAGINFNSFFKKGKVFEARMFFSIISIITGYLLTNFVLDFINLA
ncbi:MAG: DUF1146 family protein [bacterium]